LAKPTPKDNEVLTTPPRLADGSAGQSEECWPAAASVLGWWRGQLVRALPRYSM